MPTMKPGPSRNVQSLIAASDSAYPPSEAASAPASVPQRHDGEDGQDADGDEDAFHDASRDVPQGQGFVLPSEDRERHDGCADVRDDEKQFEERRQVDAAVGTATGDVTLGIVEHGLEEGQRGDRGDERDRGRARR